MTPTLQTEALGVLIDIRHRVELHLVNGSDYIASDGWLFSKPRIEGKLLKINAWKEKETGVNGIDIETEATDRELFAAYVRDQYEQGCKYFGVEL